MNLAAMQARLKAVGEELTALLAKDAFSDEDLVKVRELTSESKSLNTNIETLLEAEQVRAAAAQPAQAPVGASAAVPAQPTEKLSTSAKVGLMAASLVRSYKERGNKSPEAVFDTMEKAGFGAVASEFAAGARQRALNSGAASAGGILVPESMATDIIDILQPRTTFLQNNPRPISLAGGSYKMPAAMASATANWRGEGKAIKVSEPTFRDINMSPKFLDAMVPMTDQLLRYSISGLASWVNNDVSREMAKKLDLAAYYGTGTEYMPRGITNIGGIFTHAQTGGTSPTIAQVEDDLSALELSMMNANVEVERAVWIMSPTAFKYLQNLRDGNGNRYYPELQNAAPMLNNKRVYHTTQVPANFGASTDETQIILANFDHILFGQGQGIVFDVSNEATYVKDGQVVSAFQNGLTLIKASMDADIDVEYVEAVALLDNIRWGR
jgi:HK97 family phage major capsid protein